MKFIARHWFDVGGLLAVVTILLLLFNYNTISPLRIILLVSFISLLFHQVEEYRFPGYFPGMVNTVMFNSKHPDRFPLNTQSAFIINVCFRWGVYILAIVFAEKALWIAIASLMISLGNVFVHIFLFNIKGKTFYNPGMATALLLFLPIIIYFFLYVQHNNVSQPMDYIIGIPLGIVLNYLGVLKIIDILKNKNTRFIFAKRLVQGK